MPGVVIAGIAGVVVGVAVWRSIPANGDHDWIPAILMGLFGSFAGIGLAASFVQTELPLPEGPAGWIASLAGATVLGSLYAVASRRRLARDAEAS